MKVSIITITYNSAETVEDTIQSVLSQDYSNVEYIIIDGASRDDTMAIVNRYRDKIATIISESDKGIYDAMNKGVSVATGDIVGILNSDDFYADSNVITDVVASMKQTNSDACYADLVYVDKEDTSRVVRSWKSGEYTPGFFLRGWMPPHPTFFLKRSMYQKYGHKHGISLSYLPRVITNMRTGGQSNVTIKNRWKANREDRLAWKMNGLQPGLFTLVRKPLSKLLQYLK